MRQLQVNLVLKYLHENGCPWDEEACSNAAWNGHLGALDHVKELHEEGFSRVN